MGSENWTYALAQGAFENANGGSGNDSLYGTEIDNTLNGGDGDDFIFGEGGSDTITGGEGHDNLFGGAGSDVFVFADNSGHDAIHDFEVGLDLIDLSSNSQVANFNDVLNLASQVGSDVLIDFGNGSTIGLIDEDINELSQTHFIFV